jgi:sulfur carrier protein ThiS
LDAHPSNLPSPQPRLAREAGRGLIFEKRHDTITEKGELLVTVIYRDKTWEVKPGSTVRHVIEKVGLNPEAVLAVRNGQLVNEATLTEDGDSIKLVAVVSGG